MILIALTTACHRVRPVPGYVADPASLEREYKQFYGTPLDDADTRSGFQMAAVKAGRGEYRDAIAVLKPIYLQAPLPVVYNDLGVLYAALQEPAAALDSFRLALARDPSYAIAQANMSHMKKPAAAGGDFMLETELNDSSATANELALGVPMKGEIAANKDDVDCFRMVAPAPPRDLLEIEISTSSKNLAPRLRILDREDRPLGRLAGANAGGESFHGILSPQPNQAMYLDISGGYHSSGPYTLIVRALKRFDAYEPNDNIFAATPIHAGQSLQANIMDAGDTDYFAFTAPRTGTVTIDVHNESATLIPALTLFHPDKSNAGFGPDLRTPGGSLRQPMEVEAGQTYFVQVWSQASTAGAYSIAIN